jgi:acyl dehydratase
MADQQSLYFEDFHPGQVFELGSFTADAADMLAFARQYDPLPFHVDQDAAAGSIYGGLTSSGWYTAVMMYRLMYNGFLNEQTGLGSPGLELAWLKPMRAGQRLHGRVVVESVRQSKSRPEIGFVASTATLSDDGGEVIYRVRNTGIFKTRSG